MPSPADIKDQLRNASSSVATQDQPRSIRQLLEDPTQQLEIAKAIPTGMTPERFARLCLTAINSNEMLLACSAHSLLAACMQAAALGLEPNTPLQHCYLIPNQVKKQGSSEKVWAVRFQLGYQGMVELALRHPGVRSVAARPVYEEDEFSIDQGSANSVVHVPELEKEPGAIRFYYAIAYYPDGHYFRGVPLWEIAEHRAKSSAPNSPAWRDFEVQMSCKTAMRIIWPWIPKTAEAAQAVAADESIGDYEQWFGKGSNTEDPIDVESHEDDTDPPEPEPEPERCTECGEVDGEHQDDCSKKPDARK